MLAKIHDDTWDMLNMHHIAPNLKRWIIKTSLIVSIKRLKDPPTWLKVDTTLEKPQPPSTVIVKAEIDDKCHLFSSTDLRSGLLFLGQLKSQYLQGSEYI